MNEDLYWLGYEDGEGMTVNEDALIELLKKFYGENF